MTLLRLQAELGLVLGVCEGVGDPHRQKHRQQPDAGSVLNLES